MAYIFVNCGTPKERTLSSINLSRAMTKKEIDSPANGSFTKYEEGTIFA
jgi:hypothetical protein